MIELVWGTAEGRTAKGAFDAALMEAGIGDYNVVRYSSILPPDGEVRKTGSLERDFEVGVPLGTVIADHVSSSTGEDVAAGIGLAQAEDGGVFMEESGAGTADTIEARIEDDLEQGRSLREDWTFSDQDITVVDHTVEEVGAVVVAAVFRPLEYR
jgi:arginine decarboxylase